MRFRKQNGFGENWQRIIDYELGIWELFLSEPRFPPPRTFLGNRLKFEIFTDSCAKSPFGSDSINWTSGIGIGGIPAVSGEVVEFSSLGVNAEIPPRLDGPKSAHRAISVFELLATYIGIRLWSPSLLTNKDLSWLAIPIVTDNLGGDFILEKCIHLHDKRLGCYKTWRPIV